MSSRFDELAKKYGTIAALLVALLVWSLPTPQGMTLLQHKLLTIFSGAIILWITLSISIATSTLLVVSVLYLWVGNPTGAVNEQGQIIRQAGFTLSGFSSPALWMLVTGFVLSIAMTKSGLSKRLALHLLRVFGKTPLGAILSPMFANLAISPLTPSHTARTAAMLPIIQGVAESYQVKPGSSFAKGLFLAHTYVSNITAGGFLTSTVPNPICLGMIMAAIGGATAQTSWGYWALAALPTTFILMIGMGLLVYRLYPPEMKTIPGGVAYIEQELKKMGRLCLEEKKALFFFALAIVLWSTDIFHKMNATMIACTVSTLILMPGIGVLTWKDAQQGIPWELFVYFGGVITLSGLLTQSSAFSWLINSAIGAFGLEGMGMLPLTIILMGFTIFSHIIWSTTTAMAGVMIPIYIGMAQAFDFPIVSFVLPHAILISYAFFLPFNTMGNIIMFGTGYYTVGDMFKTALVLGLVAWALWAFTAVVWFPIIGLN